MAPISHHMSSSHDAVVGMEYVADLESVCLALSCGDVLLYNTGTYELDCVGSVEVGVVCMGWSPEQDVVVLVTREDKLVLMTRDFDSITEVDLHPQDFGEGRPVECLIGYCLASSKIVYFTNFGVNKFGQIIILQIFVTSVYGKCIVQYRAGV